MGELESKASKITKEVMDTILRHSERWSIGQKVAGFLVCLLAGAALIAGKAYVNVAAGASIALFGISFVTLRRKTEDLEAIVLRNAKGHPRIVISGEYGLIFLDDDLKSRMIAKVDENGEAAVHLGAHDGGLDLASSGDGAHVALGISSEGPGLYLKLTRDLASVGIGRSNEGGIEILASRGENMGILLSNERQEKMAVIGYGGGPVAHMTFYVNKGKEVLATYPANEVLKSYVAEGAMVESEPAR